MGKLYLMAVLVAGVYFYTHPEQFDAIRGEANAKVEQTVNEAQTKATESLIGVVQNVSNGAGQ